MSKFNPCEIELCTNMFKSGKSTKDVQDYLIDKYNLEKRTYTSNFIKIVRKKMGIYRKMDKS